MKIWMWLALVLFIPWNSVSAEELPKHIAQWQANVCRVRAQDNSGSSYGTGTYLGKGLVLTAHHVVAEYQRSGRKTGLSVTLHHGGTYKGTLAGWDAKCDSAYIRIDTPTEENVRGVLLSSENPKPGDTVWKAGYGGSGSLLWHKAKVTGYSSRSRGSPICWFRMSPYSISGDSGGPVFNDYGELLGNLWGSASEDNNTTAVLPVTIAASLGDMHKSIQEYHIQCYGPNCYQGRQQGQPPFFWFKPFGGVFRQNPGTRPNPGPGQAPTRPAPGAIQPPPNTNPPAPVPDPKPTTPAVDLSPITDKLAELDKKIEGLKTNSPIVTNPPLVKVDPPEVKIEVPPEVPKVEPEKKSWFGTAAGIASMLLLGGTGVGAALTLPKWVRYAYTGYKVAKRIRHRNDPDEPEEVQVAPAPTPPARPPQQVLVQPAPAPLIITSAMPPLPATHTTNTEFVNVESDNYQRAHEQARQETAKKYPGAQEILETEKALTLQYLAGMSPAS